MDRPEDDIQLTPVTPTGDTEQAHMSNEALESTAPLLDDEKHVLFRETVEIIEDRKFEEQAICDMLSTDCDKFIPLLQTTNLPVYK